MILWHGMTLAALAVDIADGLITRLWMVLNPDKLRVWQDLTVASDNDC